MGPLQRDIFRAIMWGNYGVVVRDQPNTVHLGGPMLLSRDMMNTFNITTRIHHTILDQERGAQNTKPKEFRQEDQQDCSLQNSLPGQPARPDQQTFPTSAKMSKPTRKTGKAESSLSSRMGTHKQPFPCHLIQQCQCPSPNLKTQVTLASPLPTPMQPVHLADHC